MADLKEFSLLFLFNLGYEKQTRSSKPIGLNSLNETPATGIYDISVSLSFLQAVKNSASHNAVSDLFIIFVQYTRADLDIKNTITTREVFSLF